mmetsp:Transcript_13437/g.40639  ORF Transcript_13437/g.40639 Transcript_13437/m.40639 type:complete len:201 (-) Transcript_13437:39-641(-)
MREGLLQRLVDDSVSGRGGDRATVGAAEEGVCGGARFGLRSSLVGRRLQGEVPRRHDRLGRTTPQRGPRLLRLAGPRPDPGPDFDHLGRPARDGRRFLPRKKNSAHPRARQRLQRDARRPRLDLPARRRRRRVRVRPRRLRWLALHHRQRTPHPGRDARDPRPHRAPRDGHPAPGDAVVMSLLLFLHAVVPLFLEKRSDS